MGILGGLGLPGILNAGGNIINGLWQYDQSEKLRQEEQKRFEDSSRLADAMTAKGQGDAIALRDKLMGKVRDDIPEATRVQWGKTGAASADRYKSLSESTAGNYDTAMGSLGAQGDALTTDVLADMKRREALSGQSGTLKDTVVGGYQGRADAGTSAANATGQKVTSGYGSREAALSGEMAGLSGGVNSGYSDRLARNMSYLDNAGAQEAKDIQQRYQNVNAANTQDLVSSGLGGTNIGASMRTGTQRQENADLSSLNERLQQQRIAADTQLSGDALSAQERTGTNAIALKQGLSADTLGAQERTGNYANETAQRLSGDTLGATATQGARDLQLQSDTIADTAAATERLGTNNLGIQANMQGSKLTSGTGIGLSGVSAADNIKIQGTADDLATRKWSVGQEAALEQAPTAAYMSGVNAQIGVNEDRSPVAVSSPFAGIGPAMDPYMQLAMQPEPAKTDWLTPTAAIATAGISTIPDWGKKK